MSVRHVTYLVVSLLNAVSGTYIPAPIWPSFWQRRRDLNLPGRCARQHTLRRSAAPGNGTENFRGTCADDRRLYRWRTCHPGDQVQQEPAGAASWDHWSRFTCLSCETHADRRLRFDLLRFGGWASSLLRHGYVSVS